MDVLQDAPKAPGVGDHGVFWDQMLEVYWSPSERSSTGGLAARPATPEVTGGRGLARRIARNAGIAPMVYAKCSCFD